MDFPHSPRGKLTGHCPCRSSIPSNSAVRVVLHKKKHLNLDSRPLGDKVSMLQIIIRIIIIKKPINFIKDKALIANSYVKD